MTFWKKVKNSGTEMGDFQIAGAECAKPTTNTPEGKIWRPEHV